jgi:hypothetical protein
VAARFRLVTTSPNQLELKKDYDYLHKILTSGVLYAELPYAMLSPDLKDVITLVGVLC